MKGVSKMLHLLFAVVSLVQWKSIHVASLCNLTSDLDRPGFKMIECPFHEFVIVPDYRKFVGVIGEEEEK